MHTRYQLYTVGRFDFCFLSSYVNQYLPRIWFSKLSIAPSCSEVFFYSFIDDDNPPLFVKLTNFGSHNTGAVRDYNLTIFRVHSSTDDHSVRPGCPGSSPRMQLFNSWYNSTVYSWMYAKWVYPVDIKLSAIQLENFINTFNIKAEHSLVE